MGRLRETESDDEGNRNYDTPARVIRIASEEAAVRRNIPSDPQPSYPVQPGR